MSPFLHLIAVALSIVSCVAPVESLRHLQQAVNVWPKPRSCEWIHPQRSTFLSPGFTICSPPHKHLSAAVRRYTHLIQTERYEPLVLFEDSSSTNATANSQGQGQVPILLRILRVRVVGDLTIPLQHGIDESYNLTIPLSGPTATLIAESVWGAMRGLETFSQLVWGDPPRAPAGIEIWDAPLFEHRGVLLDTSRNFYEVKDIVRTIGAMSANKLNVFHWHITDSQSFPLVLPSEPNLAAKGAYGQYRGKKMQYSPDDVRRIVEFGLDHGVRVMPEIDAPGHTGSWAGAYPDIVSCADMFWWPAGSSWADRMASEPGSGQLNPLSPNTYRVYANIVKDVTSLFPEELFHAGGDEIIPGCWNSDPSIQSYLLSNDGASLSQLLEKFVNSTLPLIIYKNNRTVVYWEDVLLDNVVRVSPSLLPTEHTILQTWNGGPANTRRLVSAGYRTIVSSSDYYYLDCGHGGFVGNDSRYNEPADHGGSGGSWCAPFKTWQRIYDYDIIPGDLTREEERRLVIGGEVALWSEQSDATVLDGKLWPRAAALAESLWSGNRDEKTGKKRYAEATDRLSQWRHRMVMGRGVAAEPIQPLWCLRNPGMCNTLNSS